MAFPKNFFFGSATAAHQVEGNNIKSDYWAMEHRAERRRLRPLQPL